MIESMQFVVVLLLVAAVAPALFICLVLLGLTVIMTIWHRSVRR